MLAEELKLRLTRLLHGSDIVWDGLVGISPHQLSDGAVHTIATDEDVAFFDGAVCKIDCDAVFAIEDITNFLPGLDVGLVRELVVDDLEEPAAFEGGAGVAVAVMQ